MIANCIAVAAGKGGVLKTTIATHLAGITAANGSRVLLVDADPQGNVMFDLGVDSDAGQNLADALTGRDALRPALDVRPRLDVVCGGPVMDGLCRSFDRTRTWGVLDAALGPMSRYDLIVIDTPARELWVRRLVLTAARSMVVPSSADRASRVGLVDVARTVTEIRESTNPALDVLGVVVAPLAVRSTRIRERARARLGQLIDDPDLVCHSIPRHAPLAAEMCRDRGVLATELAAHPDAPRSTQGLAADWLSLATEITERQRATHERDLTLAGAR